VATCPACGHLFDPAATGEARRTILVVEDTEYFLQLATTVLRERYETLGVRTTRDARQVLKTREVDLILLDVRLEDGDGAEVLQALRGSSTPVLLYSNRDESSMVGEEWARLRRLGVTDVIHKGLNIEESLLQKVDRLLSGVASGR
jgi:DNA-binding response OmpR family regulator